MMAHNPTPTAIAAPGSSVAPTEPRVRVVPLHTAVGAILENQALCVDVLQTTTSIFDAAMVGSRSQVLNEAGRLNRRAAKAQKELRRLAREVETAA